MHMCSAPCAKLVSKEEYAQIVKQAINFLKGDTKAVEEILKQKMKVAAEHENYETALQLRDKLKRKY